MAENPMKAARSETQIELRFKELPPEERHRRLRRLRAILDSIRRRLVAERGTDPT